jgi:hypothetical protein
LRPPSRVFIEHLDHPAPSLVLAVVDLAQIQDLALHDSAIGTALGFDNVPVAVLFAVFEAPVASQVHNAAPLYAKPGG